MSEEKRVPDLDMNPIDVTVEGTDLPAAQAPMGIKAIDAEMELARFKALAELTRKLVPASIACTKPLDWVKMGKKVYLQGSGVERIAALWGLVFGKPEVRKVEHEDGHFTYYVSGSAGSRRTGVFYQSVEGGRSSRDKFFWPNVDEEGNLEDGRTFDPRRDVSELDVRKAAVTNWQTRAATMLTGLRGLTIEDLRQGGLDDGRITRVEYGRGKKGGETASPDFKADQVALGNEILDRAGGDKDLAREICRTITAYKRKDGTEGSFSSPSTLRYDWQVSRARKALSDLTPEQLDEMRERVAIQEEGS